MRINSDQSRCYTCDSMTEYDHSNSFSAQMAKAYASAIGESRALSAFLLGVASTSTFIPMNRFQEFRKPLHDLDAVDAVAVDWYASCRDLNRAIGTIQSVETQKTKTNAPALREAQRD